MLDSILFFLGICLLLLVTINTMRGIRQFLLNIGEKANEKERRGQRVSGYSSYLTVREFNKRFPDGLKYVETFAAGEFICEECGSNSYYSVVTMDKERLSEEMLEELLSSENFNDDRIIMHPNVVQCGHCDEYFYSGDLPDDEAAMS